MKKIAFYISNHGFGHAARNIPIIKSLIKLDNQLKIIVKTDSRLIDFMKQSLVEVNNRIEYFNVQTDIGLILKDGSIKVDLHRLEYELERFINSWDEKIKSENKFICENKVNLVISDITPWIFKSCAETKIRSILISNFTWVEIYKEFFTERIVEEYLRCYNLAVLAMIYPLAGKIKNYFKNLVYIGLSCRNFDCDRVQSIKKDYKKPIVYFSIGRSVCLNEDIDVEGLPYDFLYTEGIKLKGSNAHKISTDTDNTQDFIKAADYIITKAGWSTVSEAICAKKPMLVIEREDIEEDRVTLQHLKEMKIALNINLNQFNKVDINFLLTKIDKYRDNYRNLSSKYINCSIDIAEHILKFLNQGEIPNEYK